MSSFPSSALPAYIGSLVGADATTMLFYARDSKGVATVSSNDGINWMVVDQTTAAGLAITAVDVSGEPSASFVPKTAGAYSGNAARTRSSGWQCHSNPG